MIKDRDSPWTFETFLKYTDGRFDEQERANTLLLAMQREANVALLVSIDKAFKRFEESTDKNIEKGNEVRSALQDVIQHMITRPEVEATVKSTAVRLDELSKTLIDRIDAKFSALDAKLIAGLETNKAQADTIVNRLTTIESWKRGAHAFKSDSFGTIAFFLALLIGILNIWPHVTSALMPVSPVQNQLSNGR